MAAAGGSGSSGRRDPREAQALVPGGTLRAGAPCRRSCCSAAANSSLLDSSKTVICRWGAAIFDLLQELTRSFASVRRSEIICRFNGSEKAADGKLKDLYRERGLCPACCSMLSCHLVRVLERLLRQDPLIERPQPCRSTDRAPDW